MVVHVRHDEGLSEGSGDGENGQIKKVLSGKSLQASKTEWVAHSLSTHPYVSSLPGMCLLLPWALPFSAHNKLTSA